MTDYAAFLARKFERVAAAGLDTTPGEVNAYLHDWQREVVAWAARTGRAAIWADADAGESA